MATSGSINFSVTASDIITESLELLGVLGEGESYTSDQYTSCLRTLNMMIKTWQAAGLNLFSVQRSYLFLKIGQKEYNLYNTTTDHFTNSFVQTSTNTKSLSGSTSIGVVSATGISSGMNIGIQCANNTVYWTTVSSIGATTVIGTDGSGNPIYSTAVNLVGTLPSDSGTSSVVYAYSTTANRPMRVLEAYVRRNPWSTTPIDIPLGMISRVDYGTLSTKDSQAQITQIYFDPQRTKATVSVWPTSATEVDYLVLLCQRTLEDFDNSTDEPDYPQEWFMPLAYNLSVLLAPKYGTPAMDFQRLTLLAKDLVETSKGFDSEQETAVYFKPDTWGNDIGRRGN